MENKKIKTKILAFTENSPPYIKELNVITGSILSSILMQKLDFWFLYRERNKTLQADGSFFKFISKCVHPAYEEGCSWTEELGFTEKEFRVAFSHIGIAYPTKKDFLNQEDPFKNKFYCSYYDRLKKQTHYLRNHDLTDFAINCAFELVDISSYLPTLSDKDKDKSYKTKREQYLKAILAAFKSMSTNEKGVDYLWSSDKRSPRQDTKGYAEYKEELKEKKKKEMQGQFNSEDLGEAEKKEKDIKSNLPENCTKEELNILSDFSRKISGGDPDVLFKTIFDTYDKTSIFTTIDEIKNKLDKGIMTYCTPQYLINALDKGDDMQKVLSEFKEFCLTKFGPQDYMEVVKFYQNTLKSSFDKNAAKSSQGISITKRRVSNIEYLLKNMGRGTFMKAMRRYIELFESGRISYDPSIERFSKFVEKFDSTKINQPALVAVPPKLSSIIIPKPLARYELEEMNSNSTHESEASNWSYKCECNEIIENYRAKECKKCKAKIDWEGMDMSFFDEWVNKEVSA